MTLRRGGEWGGSFLGFPRLLGRLFQSGLSGLLLAVVSLASHENQFLSHGVVDREGLLVRGVPDTVDRCAGERFPSLASSLTDEKALDPFLRQGYRESELLFRQKDAEHIALTLVEMRDVAEAIFLKVEKTACFQGFTDRFSVAAATLILGLSQTGTERWACPKEQ